MSTIPINMPDGTVEHIPAESVVNASTAMLEAMRRPPALHRIQMIPVRIDVDRDTSQIKGGSAYVKHPARMRIAAAAGCRMVGAPRTWQEAEEGGKVRTFARVAMNRPGFVNEPVTQQADGIEADQAPGNREHFTAKLVTRATARCLKVLLGESFLYDPQFLRERDGLFVFACISPDMDDPDVRQVMLDRMRAASGALYGSAPAQIQNMGEPVRLLDHNGDEHEPYEDFDDMPEGGGQDGDVSTADPTGSCPNPDPPAAPPAWVSSFVRDKASGAVNWESINDDSKRAALKRGIAELAYPKKDDPASVIALASEGKLIEACKALYEFGGGDA